MREFPSKTAMLLALAFYIPITLAAESAITISSPKDGDKFKSTEKIKISYKATFGKNDHHLHLYVDDQPEIMLKKVKGTFTLEPLAPGKHGICIRIQDKEHADTGIQECAMFRVE